jgi:hypothetical protein
MRKSKCARNARRKRKEMRVSEIYVQGEERKEASVRGKGECMEESAKMRITRSGAFQHTCNTEGHSSTP